MDETKDQSKLYTFSDDLKQRLKDPVFKSGFDAWGHALKEEIIPRDKIIDRQRTEIRERDEMIKELVDYVDCWANFSNGEPVAKELSAKAKKLLGRI